VHQYGWLSEISCVIFGHLCSKFHVAQAGKVLGGYSHPEQDQGGWLSEIGCVIFGHLCTKFYVAQAGKVLAGYSHPEQDVSLPSLDCLQASDHITGVQPTKSECSPTLTAMSYDHENDLNPQLP
jgi:hypothetical protein